MRAAVSGAAGLIGSHLVDLLLARGDEVVAIDNLATGSWDNLPDRPGLTKIESDACEPWPVQGPLDRVFHLASPASPRDFSELALEIMEVNSAGCRRALDLAAETGAVCIFASTSEVYGDPQISPQPESYWGNVNCTGPRAVYDESKRFGEALCAHYARTGRARVRVVRFFNTFGPRMRLDDGRAVPNFICQALRGEDITLYGSGEQTRSFGFIGDSARGLLLLADSDVEGPVNIGNDREIPVREIAEAIKEITGSPSRIVQVEAAIDDPQQRRPDLTRARTLLGYEPRVGLKDGLAETISDFRARLKLPG